MWMTDLMIEELSHLYTSSFRPFLAGGRFGNSAASRESEENRKWVNKIWWYGTVDWSVC